MRRPRDDQHMRRVRVGDIRCDERFNRHLDTGWVRRLIPTLDPDGLGAVILSERADGTVVYLDGQHRGTAAADKWGPNFMIPAIVHTDLSLEEEAALFLKLNKRRGLRPFDDFKAEVVARDECAVRIVKVLGDFGLGYAQSPGATKVACFQVLYDLDRLGVLSDTLALVVGAWGHDASTFNSKLLKGIGLVLARHGGEMDMAALRRKLATHRGQANGVLSVARSWKELHNWSMPRSVAGYVVNLYNKGRTKNMLPPWA